MRAPFLFGSFLSLVFPRDYRLTSAPRPMTLILALRRHDSCDDTLARELTGPGLSSADKGGARLAVMPAQRTVIRINRSVNLHGGVFFSFFFFFLSLREGCGWRD